MMSAQAAAQAYKDLGWVSIPLKPKTKQPIAAEWQNTQLADVDPKTFNDGRNIGVLLGEPSAGLVDIDIDCPEARAVAKEILPPTGLVFGRPSNPDSHYIYKAVNCGSTLQYEADDGVSLLEYRSTGAQTVFPPSIHPNGEVSTFNSQELVPSAVSGEELVSATKRLAAVSLLARRWKGGVRHHIALSLSGWLLRSGWDFNQAVVLIQQICRAAADDEIDDRMAALESTIKRLHAEENVQGLPSLIALVGKGVTDRLSKWLGISTSHVEMGEPNSQEPEGFENTDAGNAQRFVQQHGHEVKHITDMGVWLVWNGAYWQMSDDKSVALKAQKTAKAILSELSNARGPAWHKALEWAKQSNNLGKMRAMCEVAKPHLAIESKILDANPYLLNFLNGTLDLRNMDFRDFNKDDWITKQVPINFDALAPCPRFKDFLKMTFGGDETLIQFVQRAVGYSLSGDISEQCFFIAYGTGANGKSTLLHILAELLTEYACNTPMETLAAKKSSGGIPNDVARLRGMRLATASEGERNHKLAVALVKQITGGDTITARFLQKEFFEFKPQCKLWLATNHKPQIEGDDPAIWRRVMLIPFSVRVPEHQRDPKLGEKLSAELPGIMNWAVQGFMQWQKGGLQPPEAVLAATNNYQNEMNHVNRFAKDEIEKAMGGRVTKDSMHEAYIQWAENNGGESLSKQALHNRLTNLGYQDKRGSKGQRYWVDVKLKEENE